MTIANRVRRAIDLQVLDRINRVSDRSSRLKAWQRDRFLAQAPRFVAVLGFEASDGTRYIIRADDAVIGGQISRKGSYEAESVEIVLGLLRDRGVMIDQLLDIGANIGTTTVEVLKRLPNATCVAFEPEPRNFALLEHNVLANGLRDRVTAHRLALSDADGLVEFELSEANYGDHRVRKGAAAGSGHFHEATRKTIEVRSRTLDSLVASGDIVISPNTLIYMDVQGHEGHVLAGARDALGAFPPIAMEYWPYGLERAGGRQLVGQLLSPYSSLIEVADRARPIRIADLPSIAEGLSEHGLIEFVAVNT